MLLYLTEYLARFESGFNVFSYLTMRAILGALTALVISFVIGPRMIAKLSVNQRSGVTDGARALRIDFALDTNDSGVVLRAEQPWQTRTLGDCLLLFDVHNPGEYSVSLTTVVANRQGHSCRRVVSIPAGSSGSYYFELRGEDLNRDYGMRDDPPAFDIDAAKMPSDDPVAAVLRF